MDNKEKYIQFAGSGIELPLFLQPWWLDAAIAGDGEWDVILHEDRGEILAALPYCIKSRLGIKNLFIPWCTAYLAEFPLDTPFLLEMIRSLPKAADYRFRLFPDSNSNSWRQNGYSEKITKTHQINCTAVENFIKNISPSSLRQIRKAEKLITVSLSNDIAEGYDLWKATMQRKKAQNVMAPLDVLMSIDQALQSRQQRQIWEGRDINGNLHATIYVANDSNNSYYLWGGYDSDRKASGASSLLFYNAIIHAIESRRTFDFEGSMVDSVSRFYKGFGAEEKPVIAVYKSPTLLGKIMKKGL